MNKLPGDFTAQIRAFGNKTKLKGRQIMYDVAISMWTNLHKNTMVWSGRFRASHRIAVNSVDGSMEPHTDGVVPGYLPIIGSFQPPSSEEMQRARTALNSLAWWDKINITNNLEYGPKIEEQGTKQNDFARNAIFGDAFTVTRDKVLEIVSAASYGGV